jgi:radical SAM protein with 4Fe4S-binding SPASM domain
MPAADKFRRYYEASGNFRIRSILPDRCMRLWFNPVVTWDGRVVHCCFDKDAGFVMGDLKTESFRSVWNGTAYRNFRKMILTGRKKVAICRNCTSGLSRKVIR